MLMTSQLPIQITKFAIIFLTCTSAPHFLKGSATHARFILFLKSQTSIYSKNCLSDLKRKSFKLLSSQKNWLRGDIMKRCVVDGTKANFDLFGDGKFVVWFHDSNHIEICHHPTMGLLSIVLKGNVKRYRKRQQRILLICCWLWKTRMPRNKTFFLRNYGNLLRVIHRFDKRLFLCNTAFRTTCQNNPCMERYIAFLCQRSCWWWWEPVVHESDKDIRRRKCAFDWNWLSQTLIYHSKVCQ